MHSLHVRRLSSYLILHNHTVNTSLYLLFAICAIKFYLLTYLLTYLFLQNWNNKNTTKVFSKQLNYKLIPFIVTIWRLWWDERTDLELMKVSVTYLVDRRGRCRRSRADSGRTAVQWCCGYTDKPSCRDHSRRRRGCDRSSEYTTQTGRRTPATSCTRPRTARRTGPTQHTTVYCILAASKGARLNEHTGKSCVHKIHKTTSLEMI